MAEEDTTYLQNWVYCLTSWHQSCWHLETRESMWNNHMRIRHNFLEFSLTTYAILVPNFYVSSSDLKNILVDTRLFVGWEYCRKCCCDLRYIKKSRPENLYVQYTHESKSEASTWFVTGQGESSLWSLFSTSRLYSQCLHCHLEKRAFFFSETCSFTCGNMWLTWIDTSLLLPFFFFPLPLPLLLRVISLESASHF